MPVTVVVGSQWGDEGKGKIVDSLASKSSMVVRFQGGANAGHTVYRGDKVYKFHLLPCSVLHKGVKSIIARGVALDLELLLEEIKQIKNDDLNVDLVISPQAFLVLPFHRWIDKLEEIRRGQDKLGTTYRGIGPASTDRIARRGIRLGHLFQDDLLERLTTLVGRINAVLDGVYADVTKRRIDPNRLYKDLLKRREHIRKYVGDTHNFIHEAIENGEEVLMEGAQGSLLDLGFGTYPFVTSSHTISGSACVNAGLGPGQINKVLGIAKAYITRVGAGPFPTKMDKDWNEAVQKKGNEFGATTGRPRDCGWLDIPLLRYANRLNGFSGIILTKADILGGMGDIKICTSWTWENKEYKNVPEDSRVWNESVPNYVSLEGWPDFSGIEKWDDLPTGLKKYCQFIEKNSGVEILAVSTGPGIDDIAWKN